MVVATSDGVKLICTLAVALKFASKGLRNVDLVGILGGDRIPVHHVEVTGGIGRPNEYMVWKGRWHSLL
jgi:hypothetical protein